VAQHFANINAFLLEYGFVNVDFVVQNAIH